VTGAGGAFKQVLVDTGAGAQLAQLTLTLGLTPLFAGYCLALLVRVAQGSATVAMITAAGMTAPLMAGLDMSALEAAFVVIAIAAGASALSHVNDSGFWLVSRVFRLSEADTLRSWTLSTLVLSVTGLVVSAVAVFVVG
jgi:Gnt-I system low-affinity gluconate transporter